VDTDQADKGHDPSSIDGEVGASPDARFGPLGPLVATVRWAWRRTKTSNIVLTIILRVIALLLLPIVLVLELALALVLLVVFLWLWGQNKMTQTSQRPNARPEGGDSAL